MKIFPMMASARHVQGMARDSIDQALHEFGLPPVHVRYDVYWSQCIDNTFDELVRTDFDWILTFDSDSMVRAKHLEV